MTRGGGGEGAAVEELVREGNASVVVTDWYGRTALHHAVKRSCVGNVAQHAHTDAHARTHTHAHVCVCVCARANAHTHMMLKHRHTGGVKALLALGADANAADSHGYV